MYGTTAQYNRLQFAHDMAAPADNWDSEDDGLPTADDMIEKYRQEAIDALWECNASNKGYVTEAEIAETALIFAADNGENWN